MYFEIIGKITEIETIAIGQRVREIARLREQFGRGRWRKLKGTARVRLKNGRIPQGRVTLVRVSRNWEEKIENQAVFGLNVMRSKIKNPERRFVVCIHNEGCEDLELRKIYQVLTDQTPAKDGYIRVIDESGEDYLYPADNFLPIDSRRS